MSAWIAGCGAAPAPSRVVGEVRYAGVLRGALVVAAYATFPPSGDPIATVAIAEPRFPQTYALDVPGGVGTVYLLAMLDVAPEDGFRYHSTIDAGGAWPQLLQPAALRVGPGADARAHIELEDPRAGLPSP